MIPYNPSSFDTNKTILQQILELKKWLQDHPSYEVFYSSENGDTTQPVTNYDLTAIADPTNLEVGDVVIFANVTVAVVTSVDTDNNEFGCDTAVSFKGAQGPQGIQGPQGNPGVNGTNGTNGVSITNVQINSNNKLICTLSDGNTIDAGYIWYLINTSTSSSGTLTGPNLTSVNQPYVYWHTGKNLGTPKYHARLQLVDGFSETTKVFSTVINDNGALYQIQIEVDSSTGVWSRTETPLSASSVNRVDVTTASGTLSADDLAKAKGTDYCILVYTDNGVELTMSRIIQDSSYVYFYTNFIENSCAQYLIAEIDASTGAYTIAGDNLPIKADNINSDTATSGQVLTADGNGGASWQTAGGITLTYYDTASGTSITTLGTLYNAVKAIFTNSKGSYHGYIGIKIKLNNVNKVLTIPLDAVAYVDSSTYMFINTTITNVWSSENYIVSIYYEGSYGSGSITAKAIKLSSMTEETPANIAFNDGRIWYWNDSSLY